MVGTIDGCDGEGEVVSSVNLNCDVFVRVMVLVEDIMENVRFQNKGHSTPGLNRAGLGNDGVARDIGRGVET